MATQDYLQKSSDGSTINGLNDSVIFQDTTNSRIGVGTSNPDGRFDIAAGSDSSKKILTLNENIDSGKECFEIRSINGSIMVIPRQRTSAGIQAAVDYLESFESYLYGGGTVFLPGGAEYDITSSINIGKYDGSSGSKKFGNGIQIVGAGALKTILRINNTNDMSAIKINGGQTDNTPQNSANVVIRDLQIIGRADQDDLHTGIENIHGCGVLVENVFIAGPGFTHRLKYGIKSTCWTNTYHSCGIFQVSQAGIFLTAAMLYNNTLTGPNSEKIVNCSIGGFKRIDASTHVYGINIDNGVGNLVTGCSFNSGELHSQYGDTGKNIPIRIGSNTEQTIITNNYFEAGDTGIKIECKGDTIMGNFYGVCGDFITMVNPSQNASGNVIMNNYHNGVSYDHPESNTDPTVFYGKVVHGNPATERGTESIGWLPDIHTVFGNSYIADPGILGSESMQNGNFSSGSSYWTTDHVNITGETAVFTPDANNAASLTQTQANLAVAGVGSRLYKLAYTVITPLKTTGSINSASTSLTIANAIDFQNGQGICVNGAGQSGANLITTIVSGGGTTTLTLATAASTTVSGTAVRHSTEGTTTGSINNGSTSLALTNAIDFQNGQGIIVIGAGPGGANLTTTIASGGGTTTLTLATTASTSVTNAAVCHTGTAACVTSLFAIADTYLNLTNEGDHVLYFKSAQSPSDFLIWAPPNTDSFTLDNLSLMEIQGGDAIVHGLITGGGSSGIKVLSNGYTGVGNISPTEKLVVGYYTAGGNILQSAQSGWRDAYKMARDGTVVAGMGVDSNNTGLQLFTGSTLSDSTARITILSDGKTGVGTASPGEKLEVNGNIKFGTEGVKISTGTSNPNTSSLSGNAGDLYVQKNDDNSLLWINVSPSSPGTSWNSL